MPDEKQSCENCGNLKVGRMERDTGYVDVSCPFEDECGIEGEEPMFPKWIPIEPDPEREASDRAYAAFLKELHEDDETGG